MVEARRLRLRCSVCFPKRLSIAKRELEKAYQLNPHEAHSAAALIRVSMGLGLPRAEMEKYFAQAAVAVSPGIAAPYVLKIRFSRAPVVRLQRGHVGGGEEAKSKSIEHPRLAHLGESRFSSAAATVPAPEKSR